MPAIKKIRGFVLLLCLSASVACNAQFYFMTHDVLSNTRYARRSEKIHSIENWYISDGHVVINFTASLQPGRKKRQYHIVLPLDSILILVRPTPSFQREIPEDSLRTIRAISRRYSDLPGYPSGAGINVMCRRSIIRKGWYVQNSGDTLNGEVYAIANSQHEPHQMHYRKGIYLRGKHPVFVLRFTETQNRNGAEISGLVINIENGPRVRWINYMALPFALIADTVCVPIIFALRGMEK